MSVREDLIAAKALIDAPEKWIKGDWGDGYCWCALGAAFRATDGDCSVEEEIESALESALPDGFTVVGRGAGRPVAIFNDLEETTHADIMALFQRAIEAAP